MIPEEDKERGINLVSQEAKRLIRLVNENLDYEKIRSNQIELYREDIQLLEAVRNHSRTIVRAGRGEKCSNHR